MKRISKYHELTPVTTPGGLNTGNTIGEGRVNPAAFTSVDPDAGSGRLKEIIKAGPGAGIYPLSAHLTRQTPPNGTQIRSPCD